MTPTWENYQPYQPHISAPHRQASREDAFSEYEKWMKERKERWHQLKLLLRQDNKTLSTTDEGVQELFKWFCMNVEKKTFDKDRLSNLSYSLINDVAVYLGDVIIERNPNLKWTFRDNVKSDDVSFQKAVITGFTKVKNKLYCIDPDEVVTVCAYRTVRNLPVSDTLFIDILQEAAQDA